MAILATEVEKRIRAALEQDPRVDVAKIDIADDDGVITLTGEVESEEARQAAQEIVGQQEGVLEVINDLALKSQDEDAMAASPTWPPRATNE